MDLVLVNKFTLIWMWAAAVHVMLYVQCTNLNGERYLLSAIKPLMLGLYITVYA